MLDGEKEQDYQYRGHNDIIQFDIISEEFSVKPCPVPVDTECDPNQSHILNIDGALSFVVIFPSKITIWRLKDHAEQLWTAANYTFSANYTFNIENCDCIPTPIAVVDGNLALLSDQRLLVCDLMQGTIIFFREKYNFRVLFLSHQMSLASLRNCQSTIPLDEKGYVDVRENNWTSVSPDSLAGSPNSDVLVIEGSDCQLEGSGPLDTHDSMIFEKASTDEPEDEKSENSWTSGSSDSLARSPNSNSLVN